MFEPFLGLFVDLSIRAALPWMARPWSGQTLGDLIGWKAGKE